jgi:hypothetical protein
VGYGIYSLDTFALSVDDNEFTENLAAALVVDGVDIPPLFATSAAITNNTSEKDGAFVVFFSTEGVLFAHNQGRKFGAKRPVSIVTAVTPSLTTVSHDADAAVDIGGSNLLIAIRDNDLEEGESPISNGIAFTTFFPGVEPSVGVSIKENKIKRFPLNGIVLEAATVSSTATGTSVADGIVGNHLEDNGNDGILIEYADPSTNTNYGNQLLRNEAEGNQNYDCEDDTQGSLSTTIPVIGTEGKANTWVNNIGPRSSPTGICSSGPWH